MVGRGGADGRAVVRHIANIPQVSEHRDPPPNRIFAEHIDGVARRRVVVGLGLDADAGDLGEALCGAEADVEPEVVARAGEAEAPGTAVGNVVEAE